MFLRCKCGHIMSGTSDMLPYRAIAIADIDADDYWEAWKRRGRGQSLGHLHDPFDYERDVFQCEKCGRIYFENPDNLAHFVSFVPEDEKVMVTTPSNDDFWLGTLYGVSKKKDEEEVEENYTLWIHGTKEQRKDFESYESMRKYFDKEFRELQDSRRIESAHLSKDGKWVFNWHVEEVAPATNKYEIYLSDEEKEALEAFWKKHRKCQKEYAPRSIEEGFVYEIYPDYDASFRKLRVTCLKCGESLASKAGEIIDEGRLVSKKESNKASMVLNLLHERGATTHGLGNLEDFHMYCFLSAAVGYIKGLIDALKLTGEEGELPTIFKQMLDFEYLSPDLYVFLNSLIAFEPFDCAIKEMLPHLKRVLKEKFNTKEFDWIDEPDENVSSIDWLHANPHQFMTNSSPQKSSSKKELS